jgi:hypothetical protein
VPKAIEQHLDSNPYSSFVRARVFAAEWCAVYRSQYPRNACIKQTLQYKN